MKRKKHICLISGKRGGFGAMLPTMELINSSSEMKLSVIATDQHLYEKFGKTIDELKSKIQLTCSIDLEQAGDSNADRGEAVGVCLQKMSRILEKIKPDILLVIGDRGEVFASCIAAHNLRIAIAHVQGGDISGSLDEPVRHAITKLAHIHFPSTELSASRILKMGEEPWRIHTVGDTHIDQIFSSNPAPEDLVAKKYSITADKPTLLVLQHSDSTVANDSYIQMQETMNAVCTLGLRTIVVYPCSDQGFEGIMRSIENFRNFSHISIHKNIPAEEFIALQKLASCFVGNSSAGLIEAPYFGLPTVNVGDRQIGRERCANVIDVPYDHHLIKTAIDKSLYDKSFRACCSKIRAPFGDGQACRKIVDILENTSLGSKLLNKRMTY